MRRGLLLCLTVVLCAGCGDDSGDNNSVNGVAVNDSGGVCSLELPLEGAVNQTLSWGEDETCNGSTATSSPGEVTLTFGLFDGELVQIGFTDAAFGELGTHDVYVRYQNADGAEWTAQDCTVSITTNERIDTTPGFGDTYWFVATGNCAGPATPTAGDADGEVMVGDFSFSNNQIPDPT